MSNKFYCHMTEWSDEQKRFISDNLQYLTRPLYNGRVSPYDTIIMNKFYVEKGILLKDDYSYFTVPLPNDRTANLGYIGHCDWEDICNAFKTWCDEHKCTPDDIKLVQRYEMNWSTTGSWDADKKISFMCGYHTFTGAILDFLMYLNDGIQREDLAEANKLRDENDFGVKHSDTYEIAGMKIRTYKNGKVEVMNPTNAMRNRLEQFIELVKRVER